jgi:hypothetical protein
MCGGSCADAARCDDAAFTVAGRGAATVGSPSTARSAGEKRIRHMVGESGPKPFAPDEELNRFLRGSEMLSR